MTAWKKCLNRYDINLVKAYDINSVRNTQSADCDCHKHNDNALSEPLQREPEQP